MQSKIDWLHKHKNILVNSSQEKPNIIEYKSGEVLYLWGKQYVLQLYEGSLSMSELIYNQVYITQDKYLSLAVLSDKKYITPKYLINKWYKHQLKIEADLLFAKWQKIIGVKIQSYSIKQMKSRWGSCNYVDNKISLNLQLVKYPLFCLEYVIVHELVHLLEPSHNKRFKNFMTKYLPGWQVYRKELNSTRQY